MLLTARREAMLICLTLSRRRCHLASCRLDNYVWWWWPVSGTCCCFETVTLKFQIASIVELSAWSHITLQIQEQIQNFPEMAPTPKGREGVPTFYSAKFSWKLHKNEENWIRGTHPRFWCSNCQQDPKQIKVLQHLYMYTRTLTLGEHFVFVNSAKTS